MGKVIKMIKFEQKLNVLISCIREYKIQHVEWIKNTSDNLKNVKEWSPYAWEEIMDYI